MRHIRPSSALALVGALSACQQIDQELPFELDGGGQTTSIGSGGGLISVPPDFALEFPAGSLTSNTQVTAEERITAFPTSAGELLPIAKYDVGPAGTQLALPARVQIAVPVDLLEAGEELSLAVALLTPGGSVVTQVTSYDLINGFLTADIDELGPVAAVVASDAIPVLDLDDIPALVGGAISPPTPIAAAAAPAQATGPARFTASCSTAEQRCFSSGITQIWVDEVVRRRLGRDMVLFNATVDGSFEFLAFTPQNVPTQAAGYLTLDGELRARLNSVIAGRRVGQEVALFTGNLTVPSPTAVTFSTNSLTLAQTSEGPGEVIEYSVDGIGTGEQLTLQFEGTISFSNPNPQPAEQGSIVVQVRLRR